MTQHMRIECDGCGLIWDAEHKKTEHFVIGVIGRGFLSNRYAVYPEYDLCEDCRRHLVTSADPKLWPRSAQKGMNR